jgi:hypothetical protein
MDYSALIHLNPIATFLTTVSTESSALLLHVLILALVTAFYEGGDGAKGPPEKAAILKHHLTAAAIAALCYSLTSIRTTGLSVAAFVAAHFALPALAYAAAVARARSGAGERPPKPLSKHLAIGARLLRSRLPYLPYTILFLYALVLPINKHNIETLRRCNNDGELGICSLLTPSQIADLGDASVYNAMNLLKYPSAYKYVQRQYWDTGYFLSFWTAKNAPAILLAAPTFYAVYRITRLTIEQTLAGSLDGDASGFGKPFMIPHVVHLVATFVPVVVMAHVNVSTRIVCSHCPVIYLWFKCVLENDENRITSADKSKTIVCCNDSYYSYCKNVWMNSGRDKKVVILWITVYSIVGLFMHANYLPWT